MSLVGWSPEDDQRPWSDWATGSDHGPWTRWIPDVWHAAADPAGAHPVPRRPVLSGLAESPAADNGRHAEVIAWWSPLFHLLHLGLGWQDLGVGLTRWLDMGRPTHDPVLHVVERWWGTSVLDFAAWCAPDKRGHELMAVELRRRRETTDWQFVWGGGSDSLHLSLHVAPEVEVDGEIPLFFDPDAGSPAGAVAKKHRRRVLVTESYATWHRALQSSGTGYGSGPSTRVDVFCRSIGWMGQYRRSWATGRWFRGQHRWHQLGIAQS